MAPQTLLDNELISVWYYPDKKVIHHKFHKHCFGPAFRDALKKGTDAMHKNGATKWLSDDRGNAVVNKEDEEWGRAEWFPSTLKAGWKFWAIVQPAKVIGQMNLKRIVENFAAAGVTAKYFSDPDEAMKWLEVQ